MWTMPQRLVERLAVDRQARMAGRAEQRQQLAERRARPSTATMSARGTITSLDPHAVEAEHVLQHRPLVRREVGLASSPRPAPPRDRRAANSRGRRLKRVQQPVEPALARGLASSDWARPGPRRASIVRHAHGLGCQRRAAQAAQVAIGIGDAERASAATSSASMASASLVRLVVVAEQVQDAVDDEMRAWSASGFALARRSRAASVS